ncbi:unnamed protein product [Adineta ricciae]|uniref:Uncharacterized protein n=1 Tax=Adineta ricciae TaxID=249248 RepID=A0A815FT10_ADIRI|nr:unnamed protein product [Adineta ricciae]
MVNIADLVWILLAIGVIACIGSILFFGFRQRQSRLNDDTASLSPNNSDESFNSEASESGEIPQQPKSSANPSFMWWDQKGPTA